MSHKYDLKMYKLGFETFSDIISAYRFLMSVGNLHEVPLFHDFNIKDSVGNEQDFGAYYENGEVTIYFCDTRIVVSTDKLTFLVTDDSDNDTEIFEIKNPNDIINEETFFQANTVADLSDIENGPEWFTTIMNCYANVSDFLESDDV